MYLFVSVCVMCVCVFVSTCLYSFVHVCDFILRMYVFSFLYVCMQADVKVHKRKSNRVADCRQEWFLHFSVMNFVLMTSIHVIGINNVFNVARMGFQFIILA